MTSASIVNVPMKSANVTAGAANKTESNGEDFVKMMSKSLTNVKTNVGAQTEAAKGKDSDVSKTSEIDERDTYKFENKADAKIKLQSDVDKDAKEAAESAVDKYEGKVRKELTEKLGISDEDLNQALETLGLNISDLMQPQNLVAVIGELTGNQDSLSMLLDENISALITEMNGFVQDLTKEVGMDVPNILALTEMDDSNANPEVLVSQLEELGISVEELTPETISTLPEEIQKKIQEMIPEKMDGTVVKEEQAATVLGETKETLAEVAEPETTAVEDGVSETTVEITNTSSETEDQSTKNGTDSSAEELLNRSIEQREQPQVAMNASASTTTFDQTITSVQSETSSASTSQIDVQRMITDIVDQAKVTITEEVKTMEMVLNPEHLGKLFMEVSTKDGQISAKIYTENEAVKTALENQLVVFKENMNQQGMKIDAVEVSVGTHEFERNLEERASDEERRDAENFMQQEQNNQKNGRMRNIDLNNLDNLQGLMSEEEQLVAQIMKDNGNSVDYMA